MAGDHLIRAAGVVLLRTVDGAAETLVVHRPHRGDWSLPKGKLEPGEHVLSAAVREADEETGYQVTLGAPLGHLAYTALGQPKRVDYWVGRTRDDEGFTPSNEIDEIRWLPVAQARSQLTYAHDADLVGRAAALPATSPLIVLRHTQAVKRSDFKGRVDAERPLSGKGRSHAKALIPLLDAFGIEQVHSSDSLRCMQSVKKFAKSLGMTARPEPALSEESHHDDEAAAAHRMAALVRRPEAIVVCSHRPVIPTMLAVAATELGVDDPDDDWDPRMPPGGFIVLHRAFDSAGAPQLVSIERHTVAPE